MKFITSIFLSMFCIINSSFSQTDSLALKKLYEKEVIYFSGNNYVKNNTVYPFKNLESEFKKNSEGFIMFKMAQADDRKFVGLYLISLAGYIGALTMLDSNPNGALGLGIASTIPFVFSIHFSSRAEKRQKKAVWLRNRDILISGGN